MGLESTKTAKQKRLETQLAELQDRLSRTVAAFRDTSTQAQKRRFEGEMATTEAFGHTYLPHYFESESARFHGDLDRMTAAERRHIFVVHGPREHAKSTRCRAGLLRRVLKGELHYPLVVSEELKLAKAHLTTLEAELTGNPRVEADFDVEVTRKNMTQGILSLRVTPEATGTSHEVRIDAVSYGSKVKGKIFMQHRPDFALVDDFEDGTSSRNERIGREKVDWVLRDLYPAVSQDGPIVWLGNTARDTSALFLAMLECYESEDDLRAFLQRGTRSGGDVPTRPDRAPVAPRNGPETPRAEGARPEDAGNGESGEPAAEISAYCYRATRPARPDDPDAIVTDGTVYLWPERFPPEWYQAMRRTMGPATFEGEMNGCPIAVGVFFDRDWFPEYDALPTAGTADLQWFSWCDPAFGESDSASYKAIVVVASGGRRFFVVDAWLRQTEPVSSMIDAWFVLFQRWGPHDSHGETGSSDGAPGELRHGKYENDFKQDDRLRRDLEDAEDRHDRSLPVSGDSNSAPKAARIESMEALAANGRIQWPSAEAFAESLAQPNREDVERLKRQMLAWPDGYNDGPDALESAISRLRARTGGGGLHYRSLGKRRYAGSSRRRRRGR